MAMNLNYLLNRKYYEELRNSKPDYGKYNKELIESTFSRSEQPVPFARETVALKTVYPGLVFGLGSAHQAGVDVDGEEAGAEIKLGFTLDFVTGLPIIPGSTVKGALHSAFRNYPAVTAKALGVSERDIEAETYGIFGSPDGDGACVFYDAIPVGADERGYMFALDNITPHPNPLKSPNPVTMLKVLPGVTFLFRFDLSGYSEPEKLKALFREILINLGIGAKTNVGFGALERSDEKEPDDGWHMLRQKQAGESSDQQIAQAPQIAQRPKPVQQQRPQQREVLTRCSNRSCKNLVTKRTDGSASLLCAECLAKYNLS